MGLGEAGPYTCTPALLAPHTLPSSVGISWLPSQTGLVMTLFGR